MRKKPFYRVLSFVTAASIIIAVMVTSRPRPDISAVRPGSAELVYCDGVNIYAARAPHDTVRDPDGLPEVIGFYYRGRPLPQALYPAESWIPEAAAILICGLLGMALGDSAKLTCRATAES